MDIREYIVRSKEQRASIVKTAGEIVRNSARITGRSCEEIGFSASRFRMFEEKVEDEIRKVFYPHLAKGNRKVEDFEKRSSNEKLIKAYSIGFPISPIKKKLIRRQENSRLVKKKPLHSKCNSFDIKCLFAPILGSTSSRKSRVFSKSPATHYKNL